MYTVKKITGSPTVDFPVEELVKIAEVMFLVCSISLTVVFSVLFAWKSTGVEIVQYLKAEQSGKYTKK